MTIQIIDQEIKTQDRINENGSFNTIAIKKCGTQGPKKALPVQAEDNQASDEVENNQASEVENNKASDEVQNNQASDEANETEAVFYGPLPFEKSGTIIYCTKPLPAIKPMEEISDFIDGDIDNNLAQDNFEQEAIIGDNLDAQE